MSNRIWGVGTAVPAELVQQDEALQMTADLVCRDESQARFLRVLFRSSGVEQRHTVLPWRIGYEWKQDPGQNQAGGGPSTGERMALYHQFAPPLAEASARNALHDAGIEARQITHLVTVSCTGFSAPGVDLSLFESLALCPTVQRVHVGYMGCHAAINGLRVAHAFADADPNAVVLLCAVEICSLHYRLNWDAEGVKGNALFADGSASLVIGGSAQERACWTIRATGSCVLPDSRDEMSWNIGDHGFEMRLTGRVPGLIQAHVRDWLSAWLNQCGYSLEEIGGWAVHPGGPKIINAVEKALGLPADACEPSREILRNFGNMSSPTVLFLFEKLCKQVDQPIVMLAFGPGLTAEAALLEPARIEDRNIEPQA